MLGWAIEITLRNRCMNCGKPIPKPRRYCCAQHRKEGPSRRNRWIKLLLMVAAIIYTVFEVLYRLGVVHEAAKLLAALFVR
jgi:predicted nucleic acid-binding Zn ribbon protein